VGNFTPTQYNYQRIRVNVDLTNVIQIGMTFSDENGNMPPKPTWQFNFAFNYRESMSAPESIELLKRAGIDFKRLINNGIDVNDFAELMISSGLILNDDTKWIAFHSGFDFGYLVRALTGKPLPKTQSKFFDLLKKFFPYIYDLKYLMKSCRNLKGGLQDVADFLEIVRLGPQHQAGSDSLLTMQTFFKMKRLYFEDELDYEKFGGILFGLGMPYQPQGFENIEELMIYEEKS